VADRFGLRPAGGCLPSCRGCLRWCGRNWPAAGGRVRACLAVPGWLRFGDAAVASWTAGLLEGIISRHSAGQFTGEMQLDVEAFSRKGRVSSAGKPAAVQRSDAGA
jgi:hypothetical protein